MVGTSNWGFWNGHWLYGDHLCHDWYHSPYRFWWVTIETSEIQKWSHFGGQACCFFARLPYLYSKLTRDMKKPEKSTKKWYLRVYLNVAGWKIPSSVLSSQPWSQNALEKKGQLSQFYTKGRYAHPWKHISKLGSIPCRKKSGITNHQQSR